jgi:hypothetical protein
VTVAVAVAGAVLYQQSSHSKLQWLICPLDRIKKIIIFI